tara:strand:- start:3014 stop:4333 length:1320 start_codon:yes stop_codon:yes gene_type:complete
MSRSPLLANINTQICLKTLCQLAKITFTQLAESQTTHLIDEYYKPALVSAHYSISVYQRRIIRLLTQRDITLISSSLLLLAHLKCNHSSLYTVTLKRFKKHHNELHHQFLTINQQLKSKLSSITYEYAGHKHSEQKIAAVRGFFAAQGKHYSRHSTYNDVLQLALHDAVTSVCGIEALHEVIASDPIISEILNNSETQRILIATGSTISRHLFLDAKSTKTNSAGAITREPLTYKEYCLLWPHDIRDNHQYLTLDCQSMISKEHYDLGYIFSDSDIQRIEIIRQQFFEQHRIYKDLFFDMRFYSGTEIAESADKMILQFFSIIELLTHYTEYNYEEFEYEYTEKLSASVSYSQPTSVIDFAETILPGIKMFFIVARKTMDKTASSPSLFSHSAKKTPTQQPPLIVRLKLPATQQLAGDSAADSSPARKRRKKKGSLSLT